MQASGGASTIRTPRLELDLSLRENQPPAAARAPAFDAHSSSAGSHGAMGSLLGHLGGAGAQGSEGSQHEELLGGSRTLQSR